MHGTQILASDDQPHRFEAEVQRHQNYEAGDLTEIKAAVQCLIETYPQYLNFLAAGRSFAATFPAMIGRLVGNLAEQDLDGSVIIDVSGVGYQVFVPIGTPGRFEKDDAGRVTVHVHTHVAAESFTLYGFATKNDRQAFKSLLSVNKIGPKLALSILGSVDAYALADAINRGDHAPLKGISGVGKKTIERIFLDLQGKVIVDASMGAPAPAPSRKPVAPPSGPGAAVVGALMSMGYKRGEAENAVATLELEGKDTSTLLREALGALG